MRVWLGDILHINEMAMLSESHVISGGCGRVREEDLLQYLMYFSGLIKN